MIQNLAEEFYIQKEGVAKISTQIKFGEKPKSCCYVCLKKRHSCGHLCSNCDFIFNGQCPCCYEQPSWIAAKIKLPKEGSELSNILKSVSVAIDSKNARDFLGEKDRLEASLVISHFDAEISRFGEWFNSKYSLGPCTNYSLSIVKEMQNSVNYFVNETLRNLALTGKSTYTFKQSILASLHQKLFSHIGQRFIKAHRQLWDISDQKNFAFCSKYNTTVSRPHLPHRTFIKGANPPRENIDKAAETVRQLSTVISPYEKFSLIKKSWELALTSQFDFTDTDSLWDAIKLALIRASYRYLLSDIEMMNACLRPFFEVHDSYILIITTGIAKKLKEIASYEERRKPNSNSCNLYAASPSQTTNSPS